MSRFTSFLYDPSDPNLTARVQRDIPEFNFDFPEMDKLIAYTIHVYDPHTDLLRIFPGDFNRRKVEAARLAGFEVSDNGKFQPYVEDCMVGANEQYNGAIVAFVTKFNVADLPAYVAYREVLFSEIKAAMQQTDSKSKKEALVNIQTARANLESLEKKLFTDVEVVDIRNALYVVAEKMKLSLRPESIAQQIDKKDLNIPDVYYPVVDIITSSRRGPGRPKHFKPKR